MVFVSNISDPYSPAALLGPDGASLLDWARGFLIGRPQPTATYSVEQLEAMGMVGIYRRTASSPPGVTT